MLWDREIISQGTYAMVLFGEELKISEEDQRTSASRAEILDVICCLNVLYCITIENPQFLKSEMMH
jgi:hypothetical protein